MRYTSLEKNSPCSSSTLAESTGRNGCFLNSHFYFCWAFSFQRQEISGSRTGSGVPGSSSNTVSWGRCQVSVFLNCRAGVGYRWCLRDGVLHNRESESLYVGDQEGRAWYVIRKPEWWQWCYWLHFPSSWRKKKKIFFNTHPMTRSTWLSLKVSPHSSRDQFPGHSLSRQLHSQSTLCLAESTSQVVSQNLQKPKEWPPAPKTRFSAPLSKRRPGTLRCT